MSEELWWEVERILDDMELKDCSGSSVLQEEDGDVTVSLGRCTCKLRGSEPTRQHRFGQLS